MLRCHPLRPAYLRSQLPLPRQGTGFGINGPDRQSVVVDAEAGSGSEAPIITDADASFTSAWPIARPKMAALFRGRHERTPRRACKCNRDHGRIEDRRTRNDRPGPDVPASVYAPSLDRLVKDARAAEKRVADLEQTRKRTATALLFENLDQAQRIEMAVERGQSVAAFARQAGIGERRAQRLYKLAARSNEIRQEVRAGEARYGDDFVCPSWKQFLPLKSTEPEDNGTELEKS